MAGYGVLAWKGTVHSQSIEYVLFLAVHVDTSLEWVPPFSTEESRSRSYIQALRARRGPWARKQAWTSTIWGDIDGPRL